MNPKLARILVWSAAGLLIIAAVAFGLGFYEGYQNARLPELTSPGVPLWLFLIFSAVVMGFSIWIGGLWMRSIDEAAQEAHKWAWYWGGSCGMAVGGVIALMAVPQRAASLDLPSLLPDRTDPAAYLVTGAALMVLMMIAGYGVAWAVWWLKRR